VWWLTSFLVHYWKESLPFRMLPPYPSALPRKFRRSLNPLEDHPMRFAGLFVTALLLCPAGFDASSGLKAVRPSVAKALQRADQDWDSCHDDLDRSRRAASDASDAADEVNSKKKEFEECQRDRDTDDLSGDRCQSRRSDYRSAISDYQSKMDDLDVRLRDVQSSCEYDFTINRMSALDASKQRVEAAKQRLCASYRNFMPNLTPQSVLQVCTAQMGEEWCKSCLGMT
jgi:hypothetical protein